MTTKILLAAIILASLISCQKNITPPDAAETVMQNAMISVSLQNIAPNTWVEIPATYMVPPNGGNHFPQGWNKAVYDPVGERILVFDRWYDVVRGSTIYANAVIDFSPSSGQASLVKINNWKKQSTPTGGYKTVEMLPENSIDPTPVDRHPYGALAFIPEQNALYIANGANQSAPNGHVDAKNTWKLDMSSRTWTKVSSTLHPPNNLEDCMTYDVLNHMLIYFAHGPAYAPETWTMDVFTGQWIKTTLQAPSPPGRMGGSMAYDPVRNVSMLFGGARYPNPGRDLWAYDAALNTWTRKADAPVDMRMAGFAYDSLHDVFLAVANVNGVTRVVIYDPIQNSWAELIKPVGASWPAMTNKQSMAYDAKNDVFVYQGGNWQKAQWYILGYQP